MATTSIPPPLPMQCIYLPLQGRISFPVLLIHYQVHQLLLIAISSCELIPQRAAHTSLQDFLPNFTSFTWDTHPLHSKLCFAPIEVKPANVQQRERNPRGTMLPQVLSVLHQPVGPSWDSVMRGKRSMVGFCGSFRSRPEACKPTSKKKNCPKIP